MLKNSPLKTLISKVFTVLSLVFVLQVSTYTPIQAQCPMCKMTAESNLKNGGTAGKGLNTGILYMLLTPYFLIGVVGYVWYSNRRTEEEIAED